MEKSIIRFQLRKKK